MVQQPLRVAGYSYSSATYYCNIINIHICYTMHNTSSLFSLGCYCTYSSATYTNRVNIDHPLTPTVTSDTGYGTQTLSVWSNIYGTVLAVTGFPQ